MQKSSLVVSVVAAGALALGSVGMAVAQPHSSHGSSDHEIHGHSGENSSLAPKRTTGTLPKLVGYVNGNRDIEISDRTPSPGRYKIVVSDSTDDHNWHLFGQGQSRATKVRDTGRYVFKIRLKRGEYRVVCDPHFDEMEFTMRVG